MRRPRRDLPYRPASDAHPLLAAHGGRLAVDRLGTVPYQPTWELQDELAQQRRERRAGDRLLLLEHFPVYTIGRGGDESNLLASGDRLREIGAEFVRIDRGGDITFHGPGQLVAYPIVELHDPLDLRRYVRALEAAIIDTAAAFGVEAGQVPGLTGVWVGRRRKLAAIGVRVKRGVTTHGLALNVNTELRWFDEMIPCGIRDKEVTSLARETGGPVRMESVEDTLAASLARHFGLHLGAGGATVAGSSRGERAVTDDDDATVERAAGSLDHAARIEMGTFGPWQTNGYLVWDGRSPQALVLDPGMGAAGPLIERVSANGLELHVIGNSHGHVDHVFDDAPLQRASGAPVAIHPDDAYRLGQPNSYGFEVEPVTAERELRDGEQLRIGDLVFDVLHTPGHTEGSVCLYEERRALLLAGDVLFAGTYGRTDLPGGSDEAMVASLGRLARDIPSGVRVLPGHGPETSIGRELPWMERIARAGRLLTPG